MTEEITNLSKFHLLIMEKQRNLLMQRNAIWKFVDTQHSAKDVEACQRQVRISAAEISELAIALIDHKTANPQDEKKVDELLDRFGELRGYSRDMQECLAQDLAGKQAESSKVDLVKNVTFIFGLPAAFIAGVKNGVGDGHITVNEAMIVGFAISIPTVFHKSVKNMFGKAAKGICAAPKAIPRAIQNDMRVYYVREMFREYSQSAQICFASAARSINDNVRITSVRTRYGLKRILGRRNPRL